MDVWYVILYSLSAAVLITVALPFVNSSYWIFKVFEYPRFQKLLICLALLLGWAALRPWDNRAALIVMGLLGAATVYLLYKIFPYTPLARREMKRYNPTAKGPTIRIFSANVWQDNTNYAGFLRLIEKHDPDLILLLETDQKWDEGLAPLRERYEHCTKKPLDNTYGMIFYSRLHIRSCEVKFLAEEGVPSLEAVFELPGGQPVQLWGLHPKPPLPGEDLRSTAKDKELMKVAFKARESRLPEIVLGDLNDVAWSHTTELFRKTSELLDPRRGRGFYSTFHAKHWWVRFPLDYIFASPHFTLVDMKRLPPTGSDHFPILTVLHFSNASVHKQEAPEADREELQDAAEMTQKPVEG